MIVMVRTRDQLKNPSKKELIDEHISVEDIGLSSRRISSHQLF